MTSTRPLVPLALTLALVAAACSGATSNDAVSDPPETIVTDGQDPPDTEPDPTTAPPEEESTPFPVEDLFSPTENTAPLDLTGGVTGSEDGVTIVTENPRDGLRGDVADATGVWPTDWSRRTRDLDGLLLGIPVSDPRDRIPPIDQPKFEPIAAATWLDDREPGALVQFEGETRFYPLSILTRHEIVNDRFGDVPVTVTFCPLCNTAIAFDARVDGQALRFGTSGLLENSNLVMWDSETTTLWQQQTGEAVIGEFAGARLDFLSTAMVSYAEALESFPDALSLSRETGSGIDYGRNSYRDYSSSATPFLFDGEPDDRYPALSRVVGVTVGETHKAYPFEVMSQARVINDEVAGTPIVVFWGGDTADALDAAVIADSAAVGTGIAFEATLDGQALTFTSAEDDRFVDDQTGSTWTLLGVATDGSLAGSQLETLQHSNDFWFSWAAFFPEGDVQQAP